MKKIICFLLPQVFFGQVGINTSTPTSTLDVNGNVKIRTIPQGNNDDNYLTVDQNGNINKVNSTTSKFGGELSFNGSTNMANFTPGQIADIYFVDQTHTITLPVSSNAFKGKSIKFYIYGGSANFTVKGIASNASAGAPSGWNYSGTQVTISGNNNRFQLIDFICDGNYWWPDNKD